MWRIWSATFAYHERLLPRELDSVSEIQSVTLLFDIVIRSGNSHRARQAEAWTSEAHRRSSTGGTAQPIASRGLHLGSSASSADDKQAVIGDPFSILDPLHRPVSKAEPMLLSRSSKSWDVTEPGHRPSASVVSSVDASSEKQFQPGCPQDIKLEESQQGSR